MQNNTIIDSWVDWFGAMDSGSTIDKAHLESLFTAFDASHPVIDCKAAVTKHKDNVFLAKLSLNSGLNLFHHLRRREARFSIQRRTLGSSLEFQSR